MFDIEPTKEHEEFIDINTIKPFPFENWFDFGNVTIESLKEVDNMRKIKKYLNKNNEVKD